MKELNFKTLFILVLLLCITININAQKKDVEIINFNDEESDNTYSEQNEIVFKTSPFSFLSSWQSIEIEKSVSEIISFQIGAGITYNDPIVDVNKFFKRDQFFEGLIDDENPYVSPKIGPTFSVAAKFYFDEEAPDGAYVAVAGTYSNRLSESQKAKENVQALIRLETELQDQNQSSMTITGRYGTQYLHSTLVSEYFVGLGIEFIKGNQHTISRHTQLNTYFNGENNYKKKRIYIEIGVRIGFHT